MKHLSHFIRLCALSLTFATSSIAFAANADINEENTLIKDDIASAQVLTEMCPSLIGKNAKFDQNIKKMVSSSLSGYSDKSATFESLQKVIYNFECICDPDLEDTDYKIFDESFDNTFE